jgi:peptide/nickel transport system permease protein
MIAKWLGKRLLMGVIVLFLVSFLAFFIMHSAPGDPAAAFYGGNAQLLNASERERISEAFSLDKPVIQQYGAWLSETLNGNLGHSYKEGRPVSDIILERLPNTFILSGVSLFFIIAGSIVLGSLAGIKEGSLLDRALSVVSMASSSIPAFWLGILFISFFSVKLGLLPSSGTEDIGGDGGLADRLNHLIMPAMVLIISHVAIYARVLQEGVKAENRKYYVTVARANGVTKMDITKGLLRNASIPYLNYIAVTLPSFFGGTIVIESLFAWSGIGQLTVNAVLAKDFPVLVGSILVIGLFIVISFLIIDLVMYSLDPKSRKEAMQ